MLLFGGKMKAIKDYDYELNYILYQYRSLTKRKGIKPFLTLMRNFQHNKQQYEVESTQNRDLVTPLSFLGKHIENGQSADRFHSKQQQEGWDSNNFKKFMYQHSEDFFHQQLPETMNKLELFEVEQQEMIENVGSQQKQQSEQAQNDNKMLFELSENANMLLSKNIDKHQIEEFKYFMKRAINDENFQLKLESHTRTLSEQKEKETNQMNGNWSDLRSDESKENTTHSERKLINTESSPQSKQTDDDHQKLEGKQISFPKDTQMHQSPKIFNENIQINTYTNKAQAKQPEYIDYNQKRKYQHESWENQPQFYAVTHQKDSLNRYLEPIRQSQNEFYQTQFKYESFSSKNSTSKSIKNMNRNNRPANQVQRRQESHPLFYKKKQVRAEQMDQFQIIENMETNKLHSYTQNSLVQVYPGNFQKSKIKQAGIQYQTTHQYQSHLCLQSKVKNSYTNIFRPNSFFLPKNPFKKSPRQSIHFEKQSFENYQLESLNKAKDIRTTNNQSQEAIVAEQSMESKIVLKVNHQYGKQYSKKIKGPQMVLGASYVNSFKKQKYKEEKQKVQKLKPNTKPKNKNPRVQNTNVKNIENNAKKEEIIAFEAVQLKDHIEQQIEKQQQLRLKNEQKQDYSQNQMIFRSQPLKRQSKKQNLTKSTSHLQTQHNSPQQNVNNEGKQTSHIKVKSISGTKSEQQYNLLKLMGGSDHLKEVSSLFIQPKQSCFQIERQQLAHFMAANSISIKSQTSYEQSQDVSMGSSTFRFTPNNLTSFNLEDALKEDSNRITFNELSQKSKKQMNQQRKTQPHITEDQYVNLNEESQSYSPLFVNYKKFNNGLDQLEMAVIEQLQSNNIMSSSPSHAQVEPRTYQDYRNHFNPKRALSRMKQERGISQIKTQNTLKHSKKYQSLSPSKRVEGSIQGVKRRWEKNALRFRTKIHNF